jgi:hypothetical protein
MPSLLRLPLARPTWALAALALALHLYASSGYGIFRDELYFIVCGERLDRGVVAERQRREPERDHLFRHERRLIEVVAVFALISRSGRPWRS